jgi:hypothetical protein
MRFMFNQLQGRMNVWHNEERPNALSADTAGVRLTVLKCAVILIALGFAAPRLLWAAERNATSHGNDFGIFYRAAECLSSAACDAYPIAPGQPANLLPPHGAAMLWPLLSLPMVSAWLLWLLLSAASIGAGLVLAARTAGLKLSSLDWILLGALLVCSSPTMGLVWSGQVYAVMTFPLVLAWRWDRMGKRPIAVGAIVAVLASMKPMLLLFGLWLLWSRRWTTAAAFWLTLCEVCVVSVFVFTPDVWADWIASLAFAPKAGSIHDGSIMQTVLRNFGSNWFFAPVTVDHALAVTVATTLMMIVAAVSAWRSRGPLAWLLVTSAALLLSPKGWIYAAPWLIALACGSWREASPIGRKLLLTAATLACLPIYAPTWGQPNPWLTPLLGSLVFWMYWLVWTAATLSSRRSTRRQSALESRS